MPRHFLQLSDMGPEALLRVLDLADSYQATRGTPEAPRPLLGKSVALIFEKASTRTRLSLEIAVAEMGGHPVVITSQGSQISRGEPISDTARVLSRMTHAITLRTHAHSRLLELTEHSTVPVLNALTDASHPMQLLADLQTVRRVRGELESLKYAWVGDGNNMANSWIEAAGLLKFELSLACPEGYDPDPDAVSLAKQRGGKIRIVRDPAQAAQGADVISTDVFTSMGQEAEQLQRARAFANMQVTQEVVDQAVEDVMVLHCLPAHRGEEIEGRVLDGPRSFVWDQAEARLHTAKAALAWALEFDG